MHFYFLVHELKKKWLVMLPVELRGQLCGISSLFLLIWSPGIALRPLLDVTSILSFHSFSFVGKMILQCCLGWISSYTHCTCKFNFQSVLSRVDVSLWNDLAFMPWVFFSLPVFMYWILLHLKAYNLVL